MSTLIFVGVSAALLVIAILGLAILRFLDYRERGQ